MSNHNIAFGSFIEKRRKAKQLSMRKMAKLLGITPAYLSDIEKGRRYAPDKEKLFEISRILVLSEEERDEMFDLAGQTKGEIPPDLQEYIINKDIVKIALRIANKNNASDKDWEVFIKNLMKNQ
ncbi:Xre family transcriptional regulator [Paenibacillus sp. 32O-W]|nr:Xre family transcriptional regulator [Paenibacillus sp. 32O-W]